MLFALSLFILPINVCGKFSYLVASIQCQLPLAPYVASEFKLDNVRLSIATAKSGKLSSII